MEPASRARVSERCTTLTTEAHAMGAFKSTLWTVHNTTKGASAIPKAPFISSDPGLEHVEGGAEPFGHFF